MTTLIMSDYLEIKSVDHILRNTAFSTPGLNVYLALFTATPGDPGGGTEITSKSGYTRIQVNAWDAPATGHTQNTNDILWSTAGEVWGLITSIGIYDSSTGGNLLFYGSLNANKQIDTGDVFKIMAGDLDITLDGAWGNALANAWLSHILRNTAYTKPTNVKCHLYTTVPNAADAGGTEVSGGSYAAQDIYGTTAWDNHADGTTENTNVVTYPTASANWGTVNGFVLRDQAAGMLFFGNLTTPRTVYNLDVFRWSAGALDIAVQ